MRKTVIALLTLCLLLISGCVTVCESYVSEKDDGATEPLQQHVATPESDVAAQSTSVTPSLDAAASTTKPIILVWMDALTGETYYIDALTNETITRPPGLNTTRLTTTPARVTLTRPAQPVIADTFEGRKHPRATLTPEKPTYQPDETVKFTVFYERREGSEGDSELRWSQIELWQADGDKWNKRFLRLGDKEGSLLRVIYHVLIPEGQDNKTATFTLPLNDYYDIEYGKRYKAVIYAHDSADKQEYLLTAEFSTPAK